MGRVKELDNAFTSNYHGILDHKGCIKVAGYDAEQTVTKILKDKIEVKGIGKKYQTEIHKNLKDSICFLEIGDTAFVKFRKGTAYLVGFQKKQVVDEDIVIEGDSTLLEYFQEQKRLSMDRGGLI